MGSVVREAQVLGRRIRVSCTGAVFTVPQARGQGLGSRLLADLLARAQPSADLVMASGDGGLYRRQGLNPVPPLVRFRLPERVGPPAPQRHGMEIHDATADDLPAMAKLYDSESVHFIRSPADWERLWAAGRLVDAPARFSVVARIGQVVAYMAAQEAGRRADGSERRRRILEFAGDRDTIVAAAHAISEELLVPSYDTSTIALCERPGWSRSDRQFPITAMALTPDVRVIPWYGLNYL
jgi:ribosomal protein S18 acetylase RimI-like enzyme